MCVFASLPTLARIHDRLSGHDDVASFRLSKNLERPHEKIGAASLVCAMVTLDRPDAARCGDAVEPAPPALLEPVVAPLASRAPPVR